MKKEKGAIMVEAVIVFPIVLLTVFALIYLGLFKLQEMAMLYQVQRVCDRMGIFIDGNREPMYWQTPAIRNLVIMLKNRLIFCRIRQMSIIITRQLMRAYVSYTGSLQAMGHGPARANYRIL